ncbi:MAG: hypothetical protein M1816_000785 [Peltula sp. TS41687]|nr:MAG: hypothetical protein M1816_000785 [Peltula sp. TS41687]
MKHSTPVASSIGSVDFGFLSPQEIKALSVKKIQWPTTFDSLLHSTPGGLYDPALGAKGDILCGTCHLNSFNCPGHPGHIDLPVPVYHPLFIDQVLRLLRAKCSYCHRLRMARVETHRFVCKLRLIQGGLILESDELENIGPRSRSLAKKVMRQTVQNTVTSSDDSDEEMDPEDLMEVRNTFVREALRRNGKPIKGAAWNREVTEAVVRKRRAVIKEFMGLITKGKRCADCGGISPGYRKETCVKIFQKSLSAKDHAAMQEKEFKITKALAQVNKQRQDLKKNRPQSTEIDEGIVIDVDDDENGSGNESLSDDSDGLIADEASEATTLKRTNKDSKAQEFLDAGEVHAALVLLFERETEILTLVYKRRSPSKSEAPVNPDMFFLQCLLVPPNKYRPEGIAGYGEKTEAQQNTLYRSILTYCDTINQIYREIKSGQVDSGNRGAGARKRGLGDIQTAWIRLQEAVNSLIDRDKNPVQGGVHRIAEEGIKQILEKKEGLFRQNMMGKRVNFAARSVISPDPNIETNEIGIPLVFAKKLTYPEPVTDYNFYEMKAAVLNGVDRWPGAAAIENENGQVINLRSKNFEERQAIANQLLAPSSTNMNGARNKKVHRHLNNGDVVLMNRQPTLHKPSIMGHRARVLPGEKTIRMHYANCNTYNADFDGDEMNLHFPQNEIARAEALQIADTDHQYLVATSGKPLRGLIQDHISMGVWMTSKDTFFNRGHYQQLLYSCLRPEDNHTSSERILTVPPAILKPKRLWTGKQVISSIMKNIKPISHPGLSLTSKSSTSSDRWSSQSEEGTVLFKDGELLCGILDKSQLGPSTGGLIHAVYEVYGHTIAGRLLGIMGRLLNKFLHMRAFSCGMEDLVLTPTGDRDRKERLEEARKIGLEAAAKYVGLEEKHPKNNDPELRSRLEEVLRSGDKQVGLDSVVNSRNQVLSSEITSACLPIGLAKPFPKNQMQTMTTSGAKGSLVNANLISCNLGQQVLEGRRVPVMVSGKTLPCFKPFDTDIRAGGYITDRFLTGIRPQEYFFHSMAGREGLIDTAVKTSRSGYLQRCLVKGLEGLKVEYDNSVRDSDGSMMQFLYGEDGLDVTKQKHLTDFQFVAENFLSHFEQLNVREEFSHIATDDAMDWNKAAMKKVRKTGRIDAMDPVLAHFSPSRYPYSTSETFTEALKDYMKKNPEKLLRDTKKGYEGLVAKKNFETVLNLKYLKATVEPGEAVGIIAGQSIGEPSTQMTLNTFHLAGHSQKNVTMGIPRLREIVMSASTNISTPTMTIPLHKEITLEEGEKFAKAISKLSLAEIIDNIKVQERIRPGSAYANAKVYTIRINFYPAEEYCKEYAIEIEDVADALERKLAPRLQSNTRKEFEKRGKEQHASHKGAAVTSDAVPEIGKSAGPIEEASSRPEAEQEGGRDDDDDDDVANTKANYAEAVSYDKDDEDERMAGQASRREASPDAVMDIDEGIGGSPKSPSENANRVEDDDDEEANQLERQSQNQTSKRRADRIMAANSDITFFNFDEDDGSYCDIRMEFSSDSPKILMLHILESTCRTIVIHAIPGIGSCTVETPTTDPVMLTTTGTNLPALHEHSDVIDPSKLYTNSISLMLTHYGIEAARASIIREISTVFQAHGGIQVDMRHLNLLADVMTRSGVFTAFSRVGGIATNPSPFLKMSFETTTQFLCEAVLHEQSDVLQSPSARLAVGALGRVGTGGVGVFVPVVGYGVGREREEEEEVDGEDEGEDGEAEDMDVDDQ